MTLKAIPRLKLGHHGGTLPACIVLWAFGMAAPSCAAEYITIDLGVGTQVLSMNDHGAVAGIYGCGGAVTGSFVRAADGSVTTFSEFDCSGDRVIGTYANAINNDGVVAGTILYGVANGGFVRETDGTIETFNCHEPRANTVPVSINDHGTITGTCYYGVEAAFVRSSDGTVTTFNASGTDDTVPSGINNSGAVAGVYTDSGGTVHGFLRSAAGTISIFDPPGSSETWVSGINDKGVIAGYFRNSVIRGFVRAADGTYISFEAPKSVQTEPASIDSSGTITGTYSNGGMAQGFVRTPDGKISDFHVPHSEATLPVAINSQRAIGGNYFSSDGGTYGFLRLYGTTSGGKKDGPDRWPRSDIQIHRDPLEFIQRSGTLR